MVTDIPPEVTVVSVLYLSKFMYFFFKKKLLNDNHSLYPVRKNRKAYINIFISIQQLQIISSYTGH